MEFYIKEKGFLFQCPYCSNEQFFERKDFKESECLDCDKTIKRSEWINVFELELSYLFDQYKMAKDRHSGIVQLAAMENWIKNFRA